MEEWKETEGELGRLEGQISQAYHALPESERKAFDSGFYLGRSTREVSLKLGGIISEEVKELAGELTQSLLNLYISRGDLAKTIGESWQTVHYWYKRGYLEQIPGPENPGGKYGFRAFIKAIKIKKYIDLGYRLVDLDRKTGSPLQKEGSTAE